MAGDNGGDKWYPMWGNVTCHKSADAITSSANSGKSLTISSFQVTVQAAASLPQPEGEVWGGGRVQEAREGRRG